MTTVPPVRFAWVNDTLIRGSFPRSVNYKFLIKIGVKRLIAVTNKHPFEINEELRGFCEENGIKLIYIDVQQHGKTKGKNRGVGISIQQVNQTLEEMINSEEELTMIFCENGAATTSIVIGCLRRVELWSSVSISEEFTSFVGTITHLERTFLESYKPQFKLYNKPKWLWGGISPSLIKSHPLLENILINNK